jgi:hypothetical protein
MDEEGNTTALVCWGDEDTDSIYGISLKKYEIAINAIYGELSR